MELSPLHCTTCNVYRPSLNKLRNDASFFIGHNSCVRKITNSSSLRNENSRFEKSDSRQKRDKVVRITSLNH